MNTNRDMQRQQTLQDRLGLRIAARLATGANGLPHEVEERLRAAREQAISRRRRSEAVPALVPAATPARADDATLGVHGGVAVLGRPGGDPLERLGRLASVALLAALAVGLVLIAVTQNEDRTREVARLDQALLTDDLPPQAYADPGFLQFLKTRADKAGMTDGR